MTYSLSCCIIWFYNSNFNLKKYKLYDAVTLHIFRMLDSIVTLTLTMGSTGEATDKDMLARDCFLGKVSLNLALCQFRS